MTTSAQDMEKAQAALAESKLASHELQLAVTFGDWDRAEKARERALLHFENHLDLFIRGARAMAEGR